MNEKTETEAFDAHKMIGQLHTGLVGSWRRLSTARRADFGMLVLITLFFVCFFPHALFRGQFVIAGDAFWYSYPLRTVAWDMIRRGVLPLWTPHIFSGYPLLSMAQLGLGYPLTWGYLLLPGYWAEQCYVLAPYLLAPAFTYSYARAIGRGTVASLLAALAFGYGGLIASPLANNGMLPNAVMWLPLLLIAIERACAPARTFAGCLLLGAAAYSMSVLTGIGQGFLYVGGLAFAYAAFISLFSVRARTVSANHAAAATEATVGARERLVAIRAVSLNNLWGRWRPLAVAICSIALAAGVAAFQILETSRASRRSIRATLDYQTFSEGAFTPRLVWASLVAPLYQVGDVETYVPPLALLLALFAVGLAARRALARWQRWQHPVAPDIQPETSEEPRTPGVEPDEALDPRVIFWALTAMVALVLILGPNTPLYRLAYHVPILNRFRVPSRHAFEWTFAVAVLAAYGWDALALWADRRRARLSRDPAVVAALVALTAVIGALWWRAVQMPPLGVSGFTGLSESGYLTYKAAFAAVGLLAVWRGLSLAPTRARTALVAAAVAVACFVEPSAYLSRWWNGQPLPAARFAATSPVTRMLQREAPEQQRVYTRVDLFVEEFVSQPRLEGANLTALYGLHNLAGYEPLIFERYSRALGGVALDAVSPRPGYAPNLTLFQPPSHVLDLLNTGYVVSFADMRTDTGRSSGGEALQIRDGIGLTSATLGEVLPGTPRTFAAQPVDADTLALVTTLANSTHLTDGEEVARLRLHTTDGRVIERSLRAGTDTAEWSHERAGTRAAVRHRLAPVFDSHRADPPDDFSSYRYWARLPLGEHVYIDRVEITNVTAVVPLVLYHASLFDSATGQSSPLWSPPSAAWETVYAQDGALVMRNRDALPRAWLVPQAEAVTDAEALRRIRGEVAFDPRRTALLEVAPDHLPALPGGGLGASATARVTAYESNGLAVETQADAPAVLVISEMFYPGWVATVDGRPAEIHLTDYLLRGVVVPAGAHRVEMRYTAPAARVGAIISALSLLSLIGLAWQARRATRIAAAMPAAKQG